MLVKIQHSETWNKLQGSSQDAEFPAENFLGVTKWVSVTQAIHLVGQCMSLDTTAQKIERLWWANWLRLRAAYWLEMGSEMHTGWDIEFQIENTENHLEDLRTIQLMKCKHLLWIYIFTIYIYIYFWICWAFMKQYVAKDSDGIKGAWNLEREKNISWGTHEYPRKNLTLQRYKYAWLAGHDQ